MAWVQGQNWPDHLCRIIAVYALRLNTRVLFKLWPFANTGFRGAQSLVPAGTIDNRWRPTACIGRPLTALFARAAKLGPEVYGARHARARPSIVQWVLAIRETVVIKPSRLNIVAQGLFSSLPVPFLSSYTHLSQGGHWPGRRFSVAVTCWTRST